MQPSTALRSPFFSIVIPTYNRGHLISDTIASILSQDFTSYEIIIVDDGSTDATGDIIRNFDNFTIFYYKKVNGERGAARNFGWQKARGRYVTFLDSDDVFYPDHLQTAYDGLENLDFPACLAQAFEIKDDKTGNVVLKGYKANRSVINRDLFKGNFLACFGVFIRTEVISEVSFEEERKFAGTEDWLLWLQLAARHPFYFNNKVTGCLRHHHERSVLSITAESLVFRPEFLKKKLEEDNAFRKAFGMKGVRKAYAHVLTYVSLNLAAGKKNKQALSYLFKAFKIYPMELLHKRTLGIIKTILFK